MPYNNSKLIGYWHIFSNTKKPQVDEPPVKSDFSDSGASA